MTAVVMLDRSWSLMLSDLGVSIHDVARRAGVAADLVTKESFRLPVTDYFRLVEAIEAEVDDPALALRLADLPNSMPFSPVLFAALCSSTLSIAVQRLAQHKRLVAPMSVRHRHTDEGFEVGWSWDDPAIRSPRLLAATELVMMTQIARIGTRERVRPIRVCSPVPLAPTGAYEAFFGVVPQVAEEACLVFSDADARRPFLTASDDLWRSFEPELRRRLSKLDAEMPTMERTRSVLLECLPSGEVELGQAARRLGMSGRTLQRRLANEGVTFRQLVQSTRERLALHYLTTTAIPYTEVAFLLGFDEPSSFFRAFRTWTGKTPEATRRSATA